MATTSGRTARAWATRSVDRALGAEGDHPEAVGILGHDLEGLGPDRPGRADDADRHLVAAPAAAGVGADPGPPVEGVIPPACPMFTRC